MFFGAHLHGVDKEMLLQTCRKARIVLYEMTKGINLVIVLRSALELC